MKTKELSDVEGDRGCGDEESAVEAMTQDRGSGYEESGVDAVSPDLTASVPESASADEVCSFTHNVPSRRAITTIIISCTGHE